MGALRLIFYLTLCLTFSNCLIAQEIKDIVIDFEKREIEKIEELNEGNYYRIIVKNINQNLWKISLNTKDTVLIPPLETPTFGTFNFDELSKLADNLNEVTSSVQSVAKHESQINSINILSFPVKGNREKQVVERLNNEKIKLENLLDNQRDISKEIDELKYKVGKARLSAYDNANIISSSFDLSQALRDVEILRNNIEGLYQTIKLEKKSYEQFSKGFNEEIKKKIKFVEEDKKRKSSYAGLMNAINTIKDSIDAKSSIELLETVVFLKEKKGIYKSMPIQFNGDQALVKLIFSPLKPEFKLQSYEMPFKFPLKDDYWSIGVSFYGSTLYDERFSNMSVPSTDTTNNYRLVKENEQKFEIGIATLLRFGKKLSSNRMVGFHGTIGPGVSIKEKVRPRLLFGGGISLGNSHSISVDLGGIIGYVNRKSNAYNVNTEYSELPNDVTVTELQIGSFLSIGYLFKI